MILKELYDFLDSNKEVRGVTTDSRFIKEGYIFLPKHGKNFLGNEFFVEAITKGAIAIVYDEYIPNLVVPLIVVDDLDKELKRLLNLIYQKPFENLKLIGVTGTDGKTSVSTISTYLLNHISKAANIGTNGIFYNNQIYDNLFTTPILCENYRLFTEFNKNNIKYASMEVSSEGIANHRIDNILFDYAIFTNLSHEHLNTHKTMHNYFLTKLKLFKQLKKDGLMIINKDDYYARFFEDFDNVVYYSLFSPSDFQAVNIKYYNGYTTFDLKAKNYILKDLKVNRSEEYNIYNIIPPIIIALKEGIDIKLLYELLVDLPIIPGRMEKVPVKYPFDVYIDFAHTPNSLKNVLIEIRKKAQNDVILVFGAAGGKDKSKRPLMGEIALKYADFVIFTSEDPRLEKPTDIINQMLSTTNSNQNNYKVIIVRTEAMIYAFKVAKKNDIILVTGKGRENYFEENNVRINYSDFDHLLDIRI